MGGVPHLNEAVVEQVSTQLLKAIEDKDAELDETIRSLEEAGEDNLERIREKRLRQLKREAQEFDTLRSFGHGCYEELDEKEFFKAAKNSYFIVAHFYRPSTRRCEILDKYLGSLSQKYFGTRFIKINAEKAHFLSDRLNIRILPTIILVKDGKTEHSIIGFDEFGGTDQFPLTTVESVLKSYNMIGSKRPNKKEEE